ncbi:MAG: hypothetical protein JW807_16915 [Spirochaetes bacterium]|nr:hypothetical protein [Spirochaetota bacterium]
MRFVSVLAMLALASVLAFSCKMKKEITLEDYAKIEVEINLPHPDLDKARVEEVVKKYGYTFQQFRDMFDKVQKDSKLKERLGELRLQEQKSGTE